MNYYPYQMYNQPMDQLGQLRSSAMQPATGIIWVQGEAGAKSYPVARGSNVQLMDSESMTFYIKECDMSGIPSMRVFDYTERAARMSEQPVNQIDSLTARLDELTARVDALTSKEVNNG